MLDLKDITILQIELTTRCNARCPMCIRNFRGFEYNGGYPLTELYLDDIKKILPVEFLKQIKFVNFNGNLGDFSNARDSLEIVKYILENSSAQIQIETNGSSRDTTWWQQLAHSRITIFFGLDGLEDTHHLYRLDTNWNKIINNAKSVINNGGNAVWKFITFDHNKHQLNECQKLAKELGFHDFIRYDQGRDNTAVFSRSGEFKYWIGEPKTNTIPIVKDYLEDHDTWFERHLSLLEMEGNILDKKTIDCKYLKDKDLYIAADGGVYPCCWTGVFPTTMQKAGNSQIKTLVKNNNALEYSLEECIKWFNDLEKSWKLPNIQSGKPFICLQNCSKK